MSEENLTREQLIKRFAEAQGVTEQQAEQMIGAETAQDILVNIKKFTEKKLRQAMPPMNRAQRRAWQKKHRHNKNKKVNQPVAETITETAEKLNYISLIEKLRKLNERIEKEIDENENSTENDVCV